MIKTILFFLSILSLTPHLLVTKSSPFIGVRGSINLYFTPPQSPPSINSEYSALQSWKQSITDDPNRILSTWVGSDVCSYKGIFCSIPQNSIPSSSSSESQAILAVDLNHASLKGTLDAQLCSLTHLSIIHLNSNKFSGSVPDCFQNLRYLTELDLSNNQFSGPFPMSTLSIPNLIYLDLRFNSFSGQIPDELFQKSTLDAVFLNNNEFDGEVPINTFSSSASVITLANNQLSGSIPSDVSYIGSNLKQILFLNNKLTGCIPEEIGYLNKVEVLDLSYNSLTGKLPSSVSCLSGMEVFNIANNELYGELSDVVCDLKRLVNLTVAYNFFSGFSDECSKLMFKNVGFDYAGNCIPGRDMQRPYPECSGFPGEEDRSCFRNPAAKLVACIMGGMEGNGFRWGNDVPFGKP